MRPVFCTTYRELLGDAQETAFLKVKTDLGGKKFYSGTPQSYGSGCGVMEGCNKQSDKLKRCVKAEDFTTGIVTKTSQDILRHVGSSTCCFMRR